MEFGSPLMAVLSADELTAIIAHEISHGANGDPLRVQFLGQAIDTLGAWGQAARPLSIGNLGRAPPTDHSFPCLGYRSSSRCSGCRSCCSPGPASCCGW